LVDGNRTITNFTRREKLGRAQEELLDALVWNFVQGGGCPSRPCHTVSDLGGDTGRNVQDVPIIGNEQLITVYEARPHVLGNRDGTTTVKNDSVDHESIV